MQVLTQMSCSITVKVLLVTFLWYSVALDTGCFTSRVHYLFTRGPSLSAAPVLLCLEHVSCLIGPTLYFFVSLL